MVVILAASLPAQADEISEIRSRCEKDHPGLWNYFDRSECIRKAKKELRAAEERAKREQLEAEAKRLRESRARPCIAEDLKRMEATALQARHKLNYNMTLEDAQKTLDSVLASKGEVAVADEDIKEKVIIYTIPTKCDSPFRLLLNVRVDQFGKLKWFGVWPVDAPQGYDEKATASFRADFYKEHWEELQQQWAKERRAKQAVQRKPKRTDLITTESTPSTDPCAPDLSRVERLARLASFGTVRQLSSDRYVAGNHSVWFFSGGTLLECR
jgi:hypothetical protein